MSPKYLGTSLPLSARQQLLWLDDQAFPQAFFHNLVLRIDLNGHLSVDRLESAWARTVGDIDALRMVVDDAQPRQWLANEPPPGLTVRSVEPGQVDEWIASQSTRSLR